jgi:hypothetical protein
LASSLQASQAVGPSHQASVFDVSDDEENEIIEETPQEELGILFLYAKRRALISL